MGYLIYGSLREGGGGGAADSPQARNAQLVMHIAGWVEWQKLQSRNDDCVPKLFLILFRSIGTYLFGDSSRDYPIVHLNMIFNYNF